jgi:hypothetical protein
MSRDPILRSAILPRTGWVAAAIAIPFALLATPAQAQNRQQVDLYGYVAARCWVATARMPQPIADQPAPLFGAVCNQAVPRLQSQVRSFNADGTLATRVVSLDRAANGNPAERAGQVASRTALEIIVSPRV